MGQSWNFKQENFRIADVELKIKKCLNVGWNLRVDEIENNNWENWFILKGKYTNWQNCE